MGTSELPSPVSNSSLSLPSLHSPLDHWFTTTNSDYLSAQAFTHDVSSSTSSSSSTSFYPPDRRPFLYSNPLDGFHPSAHPAVSQVGSSVISNNSDRKDKPECLFNPTNNFVSAMSNFPMASTNSTGSSVAEHCQAFQSGSNQLGSTILQSRNGNPTLCNRSIRTSVKAALASAVSAGARPTKVTKRRARINKKAPIAILPADASNFRAMVQQLTGIPTSCVPPHMWGSCGAPLLQSTRFAFNGGLSTLDSSGSFLGPEQIFYLLQRAHQPLMDGFLSGGAGEITAEQTPSQGRGNMVNHDGNGTQCGLHERGKAKELSAANLVSECEQAFPSQSSKPFESLLMSDDDLHSKSTFNAVDSWVAYDGGVLTSHSPRVGGAKIAS